MTNFHAIYHHRIQKKNTFCCSTQIYLLNNFLLLFNLYKLPSSLLMCTWGESKKKNKTFIVKFFDIILKQTHFVDVRLYSRFEDILFSQYDVFYLINYTVHKVISGKQSWHSLANVNIFSAYQVPSNFSISCFQFSFNCDQFSHNTFIFSSFRYFNSHSITIGTFFYY